jgi:5'-methylthioadenosine phosphorylase
VYAISISLTFNRKVASAVIGALHAAVISREIISDVDGGMKYSIVTQSPHHRPEDREKLRYILPYFG